MISCFDFAQYRSSRDVKNPKSTFTVRSRCNESGGRGNREV